MYNLSLSQAILLVRKNFDEQPQNDSDMTFVEDKDNTEFEELLAKVLPEAINEIHQSAPIEMLDGEVLDADDLDSVSISGNVLSFWLDEDFLRLVAFQAADSDYVITEVYPESSAVGRMQNNPYSRGTYDNPVLVRKQVPGKRPHFSYYSLLSSYATPAEAIKTFSFIERYSYSKSNTGYNVAEQVVDKALYQATAKMCAIYGNTNLASYFYDLASFGNPVRDVAAKG